MQVKKEESTSWGFNPRETVDFGCAIRGISETTFIEGVGGLGTTAVSDRNGRIYESDKESLGAKAVRSGQFVLSPGDGLVVVAGHGTPIGIEDSGDEA